MYTGGAQEGRGSFALSSVSSIPWAAEGGMWEQQQPHFPTSLPRMDGQ